MTQERRIMFTHIFRQLAFSALLLSSIDCYGQQVADNIAPEFGHQRLTSDSIPNLKNPPSNKFNTANQHMAVTAHPLASRTALTILENGGNAIDAAIATQFVLGLVEPQSSGLGGGAFLVYFDAKQSKLTTFDARETAPRSVPEDLFLDADQQPLNFFDAVIGGRSVGTPGTPKLLSTIHEKYGSQPWKKLIQPAIELAKEGFTVTPRLANAVAKDSERLSSDSTSYNYFFPNGEALKAGSTLKNPDYARTLEKLAEYGGNFFYHADFAKSIVNKVQKASNSGYLSLEDFEQYKIIERKPFCHNYLTYNICGMGPPSSGATTVAQTLALIERFKLTPESVNDTTSWRIISDASRLAFADRGAYLADPDYFNFDIQQLFKRKYLKKRSSLISSTKNLDSVAPGEIGTIKTNASASLEKPSTTHFVIVDKDRNVVSMTSTIENGFGSRLMVNGFLLNNELTDFSFTSSKNGKLVANRIEPGKRPRSSMAPTIVFENGKPLLALGSPGGSRIINYVTNTLIRHLNFKQNLFDSINSPHIINRFGTLDVEAGTLSSEFLTALSKLGYPLSQRDLNSGIHAIKIQSDKLVGAADIRREGLVVGR